MSPFFAISKACVQKKYVPYIWAYLLPRSETLPAIKVSENNAWDKRPYLNMRSLVGNLCEREVYKQFLTPRWLVLVTVCFARFTGILQRLASVKLSTGRPALGFIVPDFVFDIRSEIETLA